MYIIMSRCIKLIHCVFYIVKWNKKTFIIKVRVKRNEECIIQ